MLPPRFRTLTIAAILFVASFTIGCSSTHRAAEFASPDEASNAFITALRTSDRAALVRTIGEDAVDALDSGDRVADQHMRKTFLAAYDEKNFLARPNDRTAVLTVGASDWPLPLPIVRDEGSAKWYFDTSAGIEEIVNRRIGQNELDVMEVCREFVDAQREYATLDPDHDDVPEYARKIISDPGKRNGLYWETAAGEPPSPLGPLVADAVEEGYERKAADKSDAPRPYHGYFYRLLTSQGANANGGAMNYEVKGRMIAGFALVAYPAEYGDSGIMTFITNQDGVVYQQDLGDNTDRAARSMTAFDPGAGWTKVESAMPTTNDTAKPTK